MAKQNIEVKRSKFIEKAIKKHGKIYDYSKVEYVDSQTDVCIICPEHGDFYQRPANHIRGNICPKCANRKRGDTFRQSKCEIISKFREVHGDKYDYGKMDFISVNHKITITCKEHGDFVMTPMNHLLGQGCPKCAGKGLSTEEIIERFKEVHRDKYDYSKVIYDKMHEKVVITCKEHGDFMQTPSKHINGRGCPKCAIERRKILHQLSHEDFIEKCKSVHGELYDYSKTVYTAMADKVTITCKKHGDFKQIAYDHVNGHGCPLCGNVESLNEREIYNFMTSIIGVDNVVRRDRKTLNGLEIDILVPSLHLGIEYHGLKWHSEQYKDKDYHLNKMILANENGIRLIQIFEDEYINHKDIVLSKIRHILKCDINMRKIHARKCTIDNISKTLSDEFLDAHHIQGSCTCTISLGCFHEGNLVGVMSFLREKDDKWILTRFATDNRYLCNGVGSKLFKHFIRMYNPREVKSFADLRWSDNNGDTLYEKMGFVLDERLKPDYRYINSSHPIERIHKFNCRKQILHKKYGLDLSLTEKQMTERLGLYRIYDCGLLKYIWKRDI